MSIPAEDARHLEALHVRDLFASEEFSEPLITCLDIVRRAVLDERTSLVVGPRSLTWSGGPTPPDGFEFPTAVRPLVREIVRRDPVLARHVRPIVVGEATDHYEIGRPA